MKKVILVLALALFGFTAHAQFYVGGTLHFATLGDGDGAVFGIAPEVGYCINDRMAVGTGLGFEFGGGPAIMSIDPYFRFFFADWGPVRFFADGHFNFSAALSDEGGSGWGVGVRPGFSVGLNDHFALVSHLASIGYYFDTFVAEVNTTVPAIKFAPTVGLYSTF